MNVAQAHAGDAAAASLIAVCFFLLLPFSGGILFTVAHELLHGSSRVERVLANALLVSAGWLRGCGVL